MSLVYRYIILLSIVTFVLGHHQNPTEKFLNIEEDDYSYYFGINAFLSSLKKEIHYYIISRKANAFIGIIYELYYIKVGHQNLINNNIKTSMINVNAEIMCILSGTSSIYDVILLSTANSFQYVIHK